MLAYTCSFGVSSRGVFFFSGRRRHTRFYCDWSSDVCSSDVGPERVRAGVPITFRSGPWAGKFGWEHTSTHLGDETMVRTGLRPIDYEKDELVTGLSYVFEERVRVYGTVSWAFYLDIPDDSNRFRYDVGVEVFDRGA